jgi:hypothetical protein
MKVNCVPLYTFLLALNRTTVDYFSLDVEGSELDILRTIPFHKVTFKVINLENWFVKEGKKAIEDFLGSKGYVFYQYAPDANETVGDRTWDSIFLHSSVVVP